MSLAETPFETIPERHQQLLPAVQRIPADVLEIIFMQCTMILAEEEDSEYDPDEDSGSGDTDGEDDEDDGGLYSGSENSYSDETGVDDGSSISSMEMRYMEPPATLQPPWVFTHVCRYWREVASSCPRIWASFNVSVDPGGLRNTSLPLFRRQLRNTASWPLKFEFFAYTDDSTSQLFLNTLAAHADQWESAQFCLPLSLLESIDHISSGQLQRLKILNIESVQSGNIKSVKCGNIVIFCSAPKLVEVHFWPSFRENSFLQLPPNQITRFSLCATTQRNYLLSLNLIRTSVGCLELSSTFEGVLQQNGSSITELPRLQTIVIEADNASVTLLNFLRAPSLHTLSITGVISHSSVLTVSDFIKRSSASLTSLKVGFRAQSLDLFLEIPDLVELDLLIYDRQSIICLVNNDPVLLPRLKTLTLRVNWRYRSTMSSNAILEIAKARGRPPATCHIVYDHSVLDPFIEEVENLSCKEEYCIRLHQWSVYTSMMHST